MNDNYNKIMEIIKRDRRACERLNVDLEIFYSPDLSLEVTSPSWKGPYKLENIGGEGISFLSDETLTVKSNLSFKFTLPRQVIPMIVTGTIIWQNEQNRETTQGQADGRLFCYGVKFEKIQEEFERHFIDFISEAIMDKYIDENGDLRTE